MDERKSFRDQIELIDCYCWLIKWSVIAAFFMWLGSKSVNH